MFGWLTGAGLSLVPVLMPLCSFLQHEPEGIDLPVVDALYCCAPDVIDDSASSHRRCPVDGVGEVLCAVPLRLVNFYGAVGMMYFWGEFPDDDWASKSITPPIQDREPHVVRCPSPHQTVQDPPRQDAATLTLEEADGTRREFREVLKGRQNVNGGKVVKVVKRKDKMGGERELAGVHRPSLSGRVCWGESRNSKIMHRVSRLQSGTPPPPYTLLNTRQPRTPPPAVSCSQSELTLNPKTLTQYPHRTRADRTTTFASRRGWGLHARDDLEGEPSTPDRDRTGVWYNLEYLKTISPH